MRFVVYGAGAIGGVLGGRLHQHGHEVVLLARGAHYEAIRDGGLRVASPGGETRLSIPVVDRPDALEFGEDDVVLLTMKSQDTQDALRALAAVAPPEIAVVCVQNGVANERAALRSFANVYGVMVSCPAAHLEPGLVEAHVAPITGRLDIGRYPRGVDPTAERLAAAFGSSSYLSQSREEIMRWKYGKLLTNVGTVVMALCGQEPTGELAALLRREAEHVLVAAGIAFASADEYDGLTPFLHAKDATPWTGSTWQSLHRGAGTVETEYLNGEIVLVGRLHGVAAPANEAICSLARSVARAGTRPGSVSVEQLRERLARAGVEPAAI